MANPTDLPFRLVTLADRDPKCERRRFKAIEFEPEVLLDLMNVVRDGPETVMLPSIEGLPPDCSVEAIYWDNSRGSFVARVSHPSFPVAKRGEIIEILPGTLTTVRIPLIPLMGN